MAHLAAPAMQEVTVGSPHGLHQWRFTLRRRQLPLRLAFASEDSEQVTGTDPPQSGASPANDLFSHGQLYVN